jgi:drug/metabolite transporter (DMT)-like permease
LTTLDARDAATTTHRRERLLRLLAFAVIYFVWGSTFLAIRVGVQQVPPLLFAGMRFFTAGVLLAAWALLRREPMPRGREWLSLLLLAAMIFVLDYGLLFWAEQRVASGVAAVLLATIPAFTAIAEILLLGTRRFTLGLALALGTGTLGVLLLVSRTVALGGSPVSTAGALALLVAAVAWSIASVLTRKLPLPASKITSSALQMVLGGAMLLLLTALTGEQHSFHPAQVSTGAWWSLAYLIAFGSILGFTCYLWLLHRTSPTVVGTYAYVNPLVAVLLGWALLGEPLGLRTLLGSGCVLGSVVAIAVFERGGNSR